MRRIALILIDIYLAAVFLAAVDIFLNVRAPRVFLQPKDKSFSVFSIADNRSDVRYRVYGFMPYWMLDETENIQIDKLTDVSFFALRVDKDGHISKWLEDGTKDPAYQEWRSNKKLKRLIEESKRRGVKFSLTIISHEDKVTDAFLECAACWDIFFADVKDELDYAEISNINVDFERTSETEVDIADKYTEFIRYVKNRLDGAYGDSDLVVSSFADAYIRDRITKPHELASVADAIFLMSYDFYRPDSETSGPIAPIGGFEKCGASLPTPHFVRRCYEYDITTMLSDYLANVPPSKIIFGVAYYGYNWVVDSYQPYATRIPGSDDYGYSSAQTYKDIVDLELEYRPEIRWDSEGSAPYFTYTSKKTGSLRQVFYENEESLKVKYDLIKKHNLTGVGIWALGYDGGYQELWELLGREFWAR
ncbi:hypothetical protein HYW61_00415 [candidate division WWE3 bacterium]|nr:hypothetical protein [candidate division WWE3 bacterium]